MDVDDALIPAGGEIAAENAEEAGQDDQLDPPGLQLPLEGFFKARLAAAGLSGDREGFDARLGRPLQCRREEEYETQTQGPGQLGRAGRRCFLRRSAYRLTR